MQQLLFWQTTSVGGTRQQSRAASHAAIPTGTTNRNL